MNYSPSSGHQLISLFFNPVKLYTELLAKMRK